MVLDQQAKGELEKYIDKVIRDEEYLLYWYYLMSRYRHEDIQNILQYKNEEELTFLKGATYGAIVGGYAERFYALFQRNLTTEEIVEMQEVLVNRMREIKERFLRF